MPFWDNVRASREKYVYKLTGFIETPKLESDYFIFTMQTVLTFVQQQDVIIKFNLRKKINKREEFLKLSLSTYSNLRNSLFHENLFVAHAENSLKKNKEGNYLKEQVRITQYEYNLHRLFNAVILKYIGIKNSELDCSKWYTRLPMIKEK